MPVTRKKELRRVPTDFEFRVYGAANLIPRGRVVTYKMLAERVGCGSCRAVGQALKRNPFSPGVPCHRVIASDLSIGGFMGSYSSGVLERKRKMLAREGVVFSGGKLFQKKRIYKFSGR